MSAGAAAGTALASGAALAVVVMLVFATDVVARPPWRGRFHRDPSGAWGAVVRTVAATAAAAGLAMAAVAVLAQTRPDDSELVIWWWVAASMAVVAASTVVAALWAGPTWGCRSLVAALVAVPPISAATWVEVMKDPDPQAPIAALLLMMLALSVCGGVCALVRKAWPHPGASPIG